MTQVLLAGKDWKARALLRAQLIEEGVDLEAHETISDAISRLETRELLPGLFIAELSENDNPGADIQELAKWAHDIPIWVIASRSLIEEKTLHGHGFEMIFFRPVDIGELVDQIKRRVQA